MITEQRCSMIRERNWKPTFPVFKDITKAIRGTMFIELIPNKNKMCCFYNFTAVDNH